MKRRSKAALVLVVAIAVALPGLLLPLLPYQYGGSCVIEKGGEIVCGPDHASLSFYLFGFGFMSALHGSDTFYSWCTNLGFPNPQVGGYSCPRSFRVPW